MVIRLEGDQKATEMGERAAMMAARLTKTEGWGGEKMAVDYERMVTDEGRRGDG